ncbi:hypothetical protein TWF694_005973 [Orbilia ellipsospora]|uniref:Amino acid transporter transmembrane domain-containing protein n=1 Tax=Orbilia ellipsospora TaxID=2528407 RepID=A0AAV9WTQ7_9PEZI
MKSGRKNEEPLLESPSSSSSSLQSPSNSNEDNWQPKLTEGTHKNDPSGSHAKRFVRFEVDDESANLSGVDKDDSNSIHREDLRWTYDEDFLGSSDEDDFTHAVEGGTAPLLTNIAAPSVVVANMEIGNLEGSSSRSGMKMAFMNMANSIIGAGIIGQPYAFKQAGLATGVVLLMFLTILVDWTINLIVINSKLSGADSFQSTVSACFGKWGLISISIAQWAFAFGGMVAFCIIIGDTIPHVLAAIFPTLKTMPVLWLLTNRRAVITLCILGISYPLSLYRDIAKLAKASALALVSMLIIIVTVITQGFFVDKELRGNFSKPLLTLNSGVFQAIGVISFAFVCRIIITPY